MPSRMDYCSYCGQVHKVGFISTRLAGTDGVSLEAQKWAQVFKKEGFQSFFFAGELDTPPERSYQVDEAHFTHPAIRNIYQNCFGVRVRPAQITHDIQKYTKRLFCLS